MIPMAKASGTHDERATMATRTQPQRLGERDFLDYPVFLESGLGERRSLLGRAVVAVALIAAIAVAVLIVLR